MNASGNHGVRIASAITVRNGRGRVHKRLTQRERRRQERDELVFSLIYLPNKIIANILYQNLRSVEQSVEDLCRQAKVNNRVALLYYGLQRGWKVDVNYQNLCEILVEDRYGKNYKQRKGVG